MKKYFSNTNPDFSKGNDSQTNPSYIKPKYKRNFFNTSPNIAKPTRVFHTLNTNHYNQNSTNSYRDFNEFVSLPQISEYTNPPTDESSCRMPRMVQICRNNFILKEELRINSWKYPKPKRPKSHMKPPSRLMSMMMQQFFP